MHDHVNVRVGHERGDRVERRALDRIDQVDPLVDGDLRQAGAGSVGALPQELEVECDPSVLVGSCDDGGNPTGVPDDF